MFYKATQELVLAVLFLQYKNSMKKILHKFIQNYDNLYYSKIYKNHSITKNISKYENAMEILLKSDILNTCKLYMFVKQWHKNAPTMRT